MTLMTYRQMQKKVKYRHVIRFIGFVEQEHTVELIGQHGECLIMLTAIQFIYSLRRARGRFKNNYKKLVKSC